MEFKDYVMDKMQVVLIESDINAYLNNTDGKDLNSEYIKNLLIKLYAAFKNEYSFTFKMINYEIVDDFYKRTYGHYCGSLDYNKYKLLVNIIENNDDLFIKESKKLISLLKKEYKKAS